MMPSPMACLSGANPYSRFPAYRIHYPVTGVISTVHYPKDQTNYTHSQVEYDVFTARFGIIQNVRLAVGMHGIVDDDEIILKAASALLVPAKGVNFDLQKHGMLQSTDGDQVVVQFIDGVFTKPIITNILSHSMRGYSQEVNAKYQGKLEMLTEGPTSNTATGYEFGDGTTGKTAAKMLPSGKDRLRHFKMNGTHVAVDANGDLFINFKAHPDDTKGLKAGAVTKKLVVQNEGTDLFRVEKDGTGKIKVVIAESFAANILMQVADGAKSVAIADALASLWGTFKTAFDAHVHTGVLTGVGVTGSPSPTVAPAWDTAIASTKVKIPNG